MIGDSGSYGVEVSYFNGFIVIGEYNGNILLIKTNSFGMLEWYNYFLSNDWEEGRSIVQTDDNGYVFTGVRNSTLNLTKIDSLETKYGTKIILHLGVGVTH